MEIGVVDFKSQITPIDQEMVERFFSEIEKFSGHTLKLVPISEYGKYEFGLVYIATGGSERHFLDNFDVLSSKPCYILTTGSSNSLAASMEILAYLRQHGFKGEILHGDPQAIGKRINALSLADKAKKSIAGKRLGCYGESSDWLIASRWDVNAIREKLGVELIDISMEEVFAEIAKGGYPKNEWTEKLLSQGYDEVEMEAALNVYGAFARLADKYQLAGATVRCFDLLPTVKTTGCLGLAILNGCGIYGGCEGDVPALLSMLILGEISGNPVFLCNPSRIDTRKNEMVLAHCTLPINMIDHFDLMTHYESGIGVAIAGKIPEGEITVFKTSGDLARHFAMEGEIIENLRESKLCRTQIKVRFPDYSYFTKDPINNHHLICRGAYQAALEEFFALLA